MKPYNTNERRGHRCVVKWPKKLKLGKGSTYNDMCFINARYGIEIGENTVIGPRCIILSTEHVIKNIDIEQNANDRSSWCGDDPSRRIKGEKTIIGSDVWVGSGVIILAGSRIPDKCVIGAGTLINKTNCKCIKSGDIVVNETKLRILGNRKDYE